MSKKAVVIGAGLAGLQTAWFLAQGGLEVALIERNKGPALETSFANGGLVTPSQAVPWNSPGIFRTLLASIGSETSAIYVKPTAIAQYLGWGLQFVRNSTPQRFQQAIARNTRLAEYSQKHLNTLIADLGLRFDNAQRGTMMIYRDPKAWQRAQTMKDALLAVGTQVETCSAAELVQLEPALAQISDGICGGFYYPADQHGDAHLFCRALATQLATKGASLRFGETVTGFEQSGSRISGVITDQGRHEADVVVLTAALWSRDLARKLGLRLPIVPVKGYSVTYDVSGWDGAPKIPVVDDGLHIGLTPLGQRLRIVGTAEFSGWSRDINPVRIENLRRAAGAIYPDLARIFATRKPDLEWTGLRPMTPDCLPLIGQVGAENLYLNTGHGYLGWTTSSGTSHVVSNQILGQKPGFDLINFHPNRFRLQG